MIQKNERALGEIQPMDARVGSHAQQISTAHGWGSVFTAGFTANEVPAAVQVSDAPPGLMAF